MKCYFLLRDNAEFGPFTLDEIIAKELRTPDLVWVEGESNTWKHPTEIEALQAFVQEDINIAPAQKAAADHAKHTLPPKGVYVALPPQLQNPSTDEAMEAEAEEEPVLEVKFAEPLEVIKERYEAHKGTKKFSFPRQLRAASGMWIPALLTGLVFSAFIIKKMVDNFDAVIKEEALAAAALPAGIPPGGHPAEADPSYRNALATEIVPVDTTVAKVPVKKAKKVNIKKLVDVNANDYRVGVFGGINNLKLGVNNKSDHVLDKVTIQVNYLKPNGEVLRSENVYLNAVDPKSIKTMTLPASKRGVKVIYKITDIKSHPYKAAMLDV